MTEPESSRHESGIAEDEPFTTWNEWLEGIKNEITSLAVNRHIFREVQAIIKRNPKIQKPSSFYEWMGNVYATDAVIGVRRQIDLHKDSISLARLLTDIQKTPEVLSRDRFTALYRRPSDPPDVQRHYEKLAHRDFDKFAGDGKPHVDPTLIAQDLSGLLERAKNLRQYANKRIAHFDRDDFTQLPTFNELNECLDFLETLLKKYMLLFRAVGYVQVLPVWQYDWKAIFREPWITES